MVLLIIFTDIFVKILRDSIIRLDLVILHTVISGLDIVRESLIKKTLTNLAYA